MTDGHPVDLVVDGTARRTDVSGLDSLLAVLRDRLGVLSPKDVCHQGSCGACAVWLDGEVVCSCLVPAVLADGSEVTTAASDRPAVIAAREALVRAGAVQCGICTPGIVVAAADLVERGSAAADDPVVDALVGHLCRCTGYVAVLDAVRSLLPADAGDG